MAGYVIRTVYTKVRFHKDCNNLYNKQCAAILLKCKDENNVQQPLIDARDRGGLWRLCVNMQKVFRYCEEIFRLHTLNVSKIIAKDLIKEMVSDFRILSYFRNVYSSVDPKVSKEVSLNLLEHIVGLYVRVRSFSHAKDVKERYKLSKNITKQKALRKEIKKKSSTTDGEGH